MCAEPARGGTQGAKQIFDLRDAINELFAHIDALEQTAAERVIADGSRGQTPDYTGEGSAWVPQVDARAVVVPDVNDIAQEIRRIDGKHDKGAGAIAEELRAWLLRHLRAIPADRGLGEGMVQVDREELENLIQRMRGIRTLRGKARRMTIVMDLLGQIIQQFSALRANQGGA